MLHCDSSWWEDPPRGRDRLRGGDRSYSLQPVREHHIVALIVVLLVTLVAMPPLFGGGAMVEEVSRRLKRFAGFAHLRLNNKHTVTITGRPLGVQHLQSPWKPPLTSAAWRPSSR